MKVRIGRVQLAPRRRRRHIVQQLALHQHRAALVEFLPQIGKAVGFGDADAKDALPHIGQHEAQKAARDATDDGALLSPLIAIVEHVPNDRITGTHQRQRAGGGDAQVMHGLATEELSNG